MLYIEVMYHFNKQVDFKITLYLSLNFCTIQYLVQHKYSMQWAADETNPSVTGANYCPDT